MNSVFCDLLQHDPATQPICSHVGGKFAPFPTQLREFPLDVVEELAGYKLASTTKNGVNRFALRTPGGKILEPMPRDRRVCAKIQGGQKYYNVANLLASYILNEDVTDNECGILIAAEGLWIESAADRMALCDRLRVECTNLPRVELERIPRPKSDEIDVRGKGYFVERGVVYQRNGTPIFVSKTGKIQLTGTRGKQEMVGLGWILFAAYPIFYGYRHGLHTQMDHINGVSTDNEAWNFRPVTVHQNVMVRHQTGSRSQRPAPDSSHEVFKRDETKRLTPDNISRWIADGSLRRCAETSYWVHRDGAVLLQRPSRFVYASLCVNRCGYTYAHGDKVHVMMMKAFDKYVDGLLVMHLDDDKENNRLSNLRMGTKRDNAWRQHAVQIHIRRADGTVATTTYRSECEAARAIGIERMSIRWNRKRQRPGSPLVFSTSRGITFAATDPPSPETVSV